MGGIAKRQGRHFGTLEGMGVQGGDRKGGGRTSGNFGAWGVVDWVLGTRLLRDESREDGAVVVEGAGNRGSSGGGSGGARKGRSKAGEGGSGRQTRMSARRQREDLSKSLEEEIKQVAEGLREVGEGFVDGIKEFGEGMGVRRSGRIRERSSRAGSVMR